MTPDNLLDSVLLNQSHIRYTSGGTEYVNYSNVVSTPVVGPILTVVKSSSAAEALPGIPVTFSATLLNTGNLAADTTLYDLLPEGTQFVSNSVLLDGIALPGANLVTGLHLGNIDPGRQSVVTFQLVVTGTGSSGQLTNQLRTDYSFLVAGGRLVTESILSNAVSIPVTVTGEPDIVVGLTVDKRRAAPGETLRYTVQLINRGGVAADTVLFLAVPGSTFFVRNSVTVNGVIQGGEFPSGGIALGFIPPQGQVLVTFDTIVPGYGVATPGQVLVDQVLANSSYAPSGGGAYVRQTYSNQVITELFFPVFQVVVEAVPGIVETEDTVYYTVTVTNSGNLAAEAFLGRLTNGQLLLVPGSIRINGIPVPDPGPNGLLPLGIVLPQDTVVITYQAMVSPFITSRVLRGSVTVNYSFMSNGNPYRGEVYSNSYELIVETSDE